MSISINPSLGLMEEESQLMRNSRIIKQVLSLFCDQRLKDKISVPSLDLKNIEIIFVPLKETFKVDFGSDYPSSAPAFKIDHPVYESFISQCPILKSWTPQTQLSDVVSEIFLKMNAFAENQFSFLKNEINYQNLPEYRRKDSKDNSQEARKKKVMMNGCADNELTQTKNLNRHFRSKLRQVYTDVVKDGFQAPQDAKWIEASFTLPRVGFEDIARVLKNQWFNLEVNKQMQNGKFMHKIMKGMMSIKSKKLMVKYYHVMLAAAKDPDNFVKWKYQ